MVNAESWAKNVASWLMCCCGRCDIPYDAVAI